MLNITTIRSTVLIISFLRGENLKMSDYCIYKEPDFMLIFALVILQRKVDIRLTVNQ